MADGIRAEALAHLRLLRGGVSVSVRRVFIDIAHLVDEDLIRSRHYWAVHDYMGNLVNESDNLRRGFRDWIINHPDLMPALAPDVVPALNPMWSYSEVAALGNTVIDEMGTNIGQIIGVVPTLEDEDVEEIIELAAIAIILLCDIIVDGSDMFGEIIDDSESTGSGSSSSSSSAESASP